MTEALIDLSDIHLSFGEGPARTNVLNGASLRLLPGETADFSTFAVFPGSDLSPITAPKFDYGLRDIRAVTR